MQFPSKNDANNSEAKMRILRGEKIFTFREIFLRMSFPFELS